MSAYIASLTLPRFVILAGIILVYIILGCVMEVYSIMLLTLSIIFPIIQTLGFDPIWFGVIMVLILEIGLTTPPIGLNVFVIKGSAPDIPLQTIFKGVWPFFTAAVLAMILIGIFPQIALYIPSKM